MRNLLVLKAGGQGADLALDRCQGLGHALVIKGKAARNAPPLSGPPPEQSALCCWKFSLPRAVGSSGKPLPGVSGEQRTGCVGAASCFVSASPTAPLAQEDAKSSRPAVRDVSEELSRQLEDILNTYCVDASQEGPGEDGGQSEPAEQEEAEKCRSESPRNGEQEPGGPEMNGEKEGTKGTEEFRAGEECGERDQKKAQEKKKAKGLGKSCPAVVVLVVVVELGALARGSDGCEACFVSAFRRQNSA